ncbi:MAG: helix-turn-helix domain-containing protein, partial [Mycobacterium sp.]
RGRVGGRPPALTGRRLAHARDLAASGMPIAEIADTLLVGRSTVYRALQASTDAPQSTEARRLVGRR